MSAMLTADLEQKIEEARGIEVSFETVDWSTSACRQLGKRALDIFFSEDVGEIAEAKSICSGCEVANECFALAIANKEPWGVWGGLLFSNGKPLAAKRSRGRPRKDEA